MLYKDFEENKNNIINKRNKIWIKNKIFPKWINNSLQKKIPLNIVTIIYCLF